MHVSCWVLNLKCNVYAVKAPLLVHNRFVKAIFILNDCRAHIGDANSHGSQVESQLFTIRANYENSRSERMHIYNLQQIWLITCLNELKSFTCIQLRQKASNPEEADTLVMRWKGQESSQVWSLTWHYSIAMVLKNYFLGNSLKSYPRDNSSGYLRKTCSYVTFLKQSCSPKAILFVTGSLCIRKYLSLPLNNN
ncbi:hypothetical protein CMV_026988 [Castanea mollissima]|uniref:Uncharacterized protein n=1 Tax=Castanea mollissima TaxID=60419 RepID=A0A8J4VFE2_9ROSI|nr:hypothetical protein CMV_026988 [Castanea mollissima]